MSNIAKGNSVGVGVPFSPQFNAPAIAREETLDVGRMVGAVMRRKLQVALVAVLVLIPAAIGVYRATPVYRSSALLQVSPDAVQLLPYRDVVEPAGGVYYETYMKTQEEVLRSPSLVARVTLRLESAEGGIDSASEIPWLTERFSVQRIENSQIFRISYVSPDPPTAARVVNAFAEEYIKQAFDSRQKTRQKAREALKRELDALEQRVQLSERELVRYAKGKEMFALEPAQVDPIQRKLAALDQQVADNETEVAVAKSRLQSLQKASSKYFPEKLATPITASLTTRLLQAENELMGMLMTFGEKWPGVVQKRDEIRLVRDQLEREKAAILARATDQAQLDLEAAQSKNSIVAASLAQQKEMANRYNEASIQYNILRRDVDTNQKLYEGLLDRLKQTGVIAGTEFGNIQVIEPGRQPVKPDRPRVSWILALSSMFGVALGVCVALVRDFWDESIATLEDAEQLAAFPVLGSVPFAKTLELPRAQAVKRIEGAPSLRGELSETHASGSLPSPPPEVAEAVRAVCASLLLSQSDKELRVIAVTSSEPNEGKTTILALLGCALAEAGARTLVVESDLRKPDLSRVLGITGEEGLSLFLAGHGPPQPTICATPNSNLFIIPSGPKPPNPLTLLNSERLAGLVKQLSTSFRFVLLDAPPLLAVADGRVLSSLADGVVVVVRAKRTARKLVLRAWSLLQHSGANALGVVLNGGSAHEGAAYYRYYSAK
jgi:polysaccharide biosynthesis transport protein